MTNGFEDFHKLSRSSMEIAAKGFSEFSKGMQAIASESIEYSKRNMENGTNTAEKIFTAGSADRIFEAQAECCRTAYENYIAQVNKTLEICMDAARAIFQPVSAMNVNVGAPAAAKSSGKCG